MLSYLGAFLVSLMCLGEVELNRPFTMENWGEEIEMNCFNIMTLSERYGNQVDQYVELDPSVIGYDDLRYLTVLHYGYDGYLYQGELIVNKSVAEEVLSIFQELYAIGYPIEKMHVMSCYDGDDEASMMANNSSAFNFRYVTNGGKLSKHAYGLAIDLNPLVNPYVKADVVLPATGVPYLNRHHCVLGMIKKMMQCMQSSLVTDGIGEAIGSRLKIINILKKLIRKLEPMWGWSVFKSLKFSKLIE